jgi:hypothetical protein
VPFYWSQRYDVTLRYVGYAAGWDETRVDGTIDALDAHIDHLAAGKPLVVTTINRDRESLEAELGIERQWADATSQ